MRVTFWGVRGSISTPEATQARYGGNTPCVEVVAGKTRIALDAGIGLRWLFTSLMARGVKGHRLHLLLSHYHWDHIQGIPFTPVFYIPGNTVEIYGPGPKLRENLLGQLRPDFCPVPNFIVDDVGADVLLRELPEEGRFSIDDLKVSWARLPRGDGRTRQQWEQDPFDYEPEGGAGIDWVVGYRIEHGKKSVAYLTDVEYPDGPSACEPALQLARNVDLLIHDSQFYPEEREKHRGWGHSTYEEALELARLAHCRQVALFHHDPKRTDEELDVLGRLLEKRNAFAARESQVLELV